MNWKPKYKSQNYKSVSEENIETNLHVRFDSDFWHMTQDKQATIAKNRINAIHQN